MYICVNIIIIVNKMYFYCDIQLEDSNSVNPQCQSASKDIIWKNLDS